MAWAAQDIKSLGVFSEAFTQESGVMLWQSG